MTTYLFSRTEPTGRRTLRAVSATDEQEARTIARTLDTAVWTRLAAGEVAEFTETRRLVSPLQAEAKQFNGHTPSVPFTMPIITS